MHKPMLILMVGLPGSGKSYLTKKMTTSECLSSDSIREEFFGDASNQSNNELVFRTLYDRAKKFLRDGKDVVIDATNVSEKDRGRALSNFVGMDIVRACCVCMTPIEVCIQNDAKRSRVVGADVIAKFVQKFQIPMKYEGFDYIYYGVYSDEVMCDPDALLADCGGFEQHNPHHLYTVGEHCLKCATVALGLSDNASVIAAAKYHDIGKPYCQSYDTEGVAHYFGHHNVGAYIMMCSKAFANEEIDNETIWLINHHMDPFGWNAQGYANHRKKYKDKLFNDLMLLHRCDKESTGVTEN